MVAAELKDAAPDALRSFEEDLGSELTVKRSTSHSARTRHSAFVHGRQKKPAARSV